MSACAHLKEFLKRIGENWHTVRLDNTHAHFRVQVAALPFAQAQISTCINPLTHSLDPHYISVLVQNFRQNNIINTPGRIKSSININ